MVGRFLPIEKELSLLVECFLLLVERSLSMKEDVLSFSEGLLPLMEGDLSLRRILSSFTGSLSAFI